MDMDDILYSLNVGVGWLFNEKKVNKIKEKV